MNDENETLTFKGSVNSGVNPQDDDNMSYWSAKDDEAPYSGPVTRSRAKTQKTTAVSKAGNLIASYSSDWFILEECRPMLLLAQPVNGSNNPMSQL